MKHVFNQDHVSSFFLLSFSCFSSLLTVKPAVILLLAQSHFRIHLLVFRLKFLALFCRIE